MSDSEAPSAKSSWRRLASRLALAGGLALAAALVFPKMPREQVVVFRLGSSSDARALSASFTREGEREAATGLHLSFPGRAPASVRHPVTLPNGSYVVAVEVTRGEGGAAKETSWVRRVTLEGGEIVLPLEEAP